MAGEEENGYMITRRIMYDLYEEMGRAKPREEIPRTKENFGLHLKFAESAVGLMAAVAMIGLGN